MDCRVAVVLGLGLLVGSAGCTPSPFANTSDTVTAVPTPKEKRKGKVVACVAFGDFTQREAEAPQKSPAEKKQLLEQARRAYRQALELDAKCVEARRGLGRTYLAEKDYARAIAAYQTGVKQQPKDAILWYELGVAYSRHKDLTEATTALGKAVKLDPENKQYANTLGFCLALTGDYERSLACFRRTGGEARAHFNLARMLEHMKQPDLSRKHLELAVRADPNLKEAHEMMARLERGSPSASGITPVQFQQEQQR